MYCKNCGKEADISASYCSSCGFHPLSEKSYCHHCGAQTHERQVICINCGNKLHPEELDQQVQLQKEEEFRRQLYAEIQYLSKYYQKKFIEIWESGDTYTGGWNWSAFFFGPIWYLSKGCWLASLAHFFINLIMIVFTFGIGIIIPAVIAGKTGNWVYYNRFVKNGRQIAM